MLAGHPKSFARIRSSDGRMKIFAGCWRCKWVDFGAIHLATAVRRLDRHVAAKHAAAIEFDRTVAMRLAQGMLRDQRSQVVTGDKCETDCDP